MDMLQVGRGMTKTEDEAHFTMWCMMASPLMAGNDLDTMSEETRVILTNTEVIAINQDKAGIQAERVENENGVQLWVKPLGHRMSKTRAVAVFNTNENSVNYTIDWNKVGLKGDIKARDLWKHEDLADNIKSVEVPGHGVVVLKVSADGIVIPEVYEAEYGFVNGLMKKDRGTVKADGNASGKMKVENIGKYADNWIEFPHVYAAKSGSYNLTIPIETVDGMTLTINGKLIKDISSLRKDGSLQVDLKKGFNKIRINHSAQTFSLDYIKVK